jgi:hypothetical protein
MAGPSQPKVVDEVWSDERVKRFLSMEAYGDASHDYHVLVKAYRGMRADDFGRFLGFFKAAGRDLNATDKQGRTLWLIIKTQRLAGPYLDAAAAHL